MINLIWPVNGRDKGAFMPTSTLVIVFGSWLILFGCGVAFYFLTRDKGGDE